MEGIYTIHLVPSDLSTEETVLQIADSLDNLNGILEDVFIRLNKRININIDKTNKLKARIESSREKVDKITGVQKAIKVFSSAKYPTSINHEHYKSVFDMDGYQHRPRKVELSGKVHAQFHDKELQEKLHFYHVKVAEPKSSKSAKEFKLNDVIESLQTVGELLVFDTDESPYFGSTSKAPVYIPKVAITEKSLLEAAPSSIMRRDLLKRETDEYMYAPGMGMVPELEMPLDLPHLPGIAGDVQYTLTQDGSIAPSVVTSPVANIYDAPDLKDLPDIMPEEVPVASVMPVSMADLPMPSLPVPDVPDAPPVPVVSMAPPPPPPPPPPPMEIPPPVKRDVKSSSSAPPPPAGDAHSSLMAAIRQAGGTGRAKLRPAAEATPETTKKASSGGDLMADLHAKLSMRRRGISGAERASGSVLHTLASVIPEPGEQSSPQQSSSEDDWE